MPGSLGMWGRRNPRACGSLSPAAGRVEGGGRTRAGTGPRGGQGRLFGRRPLRGRRTLPALEGTLDVSVDTRCLLGAAPAETQQLVLGAPALLCPASPFLRRGGGWRLRFEELAPGLRGESDFLSPELRVRGSPSPSTPTIAGRLGPQVSLGLPLIGGLCLGSSPSRGRVSTGAKSWRARWAWRPLPSTPVPRAPSDPRPQAHPLPRLPTPKSGSIPGQGAGWVGGDW